MRRIGSVFTVSAGLFAGLSAVAADRPAIVSPFAEEATLFDSSPGLGFSPRAIGPGMQAAADEIIADQCLNGGWNWPHGGCSATYNNITGPIGLALLHAYASTLDPDHLAAAAAGGAYDLTFQYGNGEYRFSTFTSYFLWNLSAATGNAAYSSHAETEFFDELSAGTYGPSNYDTAGWIASVQAARTGTWVNLRPWEFHNIIPAAAAIGNAGQAALFAAACRDGLDTLNNTAPYTYYSDLIGLAGGVRGLAFAGATSFTPISSPNHAGINGIGTLVALADKLASYQNADGSWNWHSNLASPGETDKDTQTTAYAILALIEAGPVAGSSYATQIAKGRDWLRTMQLPDGGFLDFPGGGQNIEVEAEALNALAPDTCAADKLVFEVPAASLCVRPGETVTVELWQRSLSVPVRGFQAWAQFDSTAMSFASGTYTSSPYGLPVISPITATGNNIDLSAGIFDLDGQTPTMADALLATLTFNTTGMPNGPTTVSFRYRDPPSRFTRENGTELTPCLVQSPTILIDGTNPVITCPANAVVQCYEDRLPATTGTPTATDNLDDNPVVTFSDVESGACPMTITRTWTVTDCAGNYSVCTQLITVDDTISPTLTCASPAAIVVSNDAGECSAVVSLGTVAETFENTPPLAASPTAGRWYVDRFAPAGFASASFGGGVVLKHSISSADFQGHGNFYATQGRDYDVNLATGSTLTADMYIPSSWASNVRRADLWATTFDVANAISGYPIVGFTSADPAYPGAYPGTATPRFRIYTQDTDNNPGNGYTPGWVDLGLPAGFLYDQWVTLKIELTATTYEFSVVTAQGTLTYTDNVTFDSVQFGNLMLQAYNFGASYDVYWDNVTLPAVATDNCIGPVVVTYVRSDNPALTLADPFPAGCPEQTTTITWTATDSCGNTSTCSRTVTVADAENPTIACPSNFAVQCSGDVPAAYANLAAFIAAGGTADDNCDATLTLSLTSDSGLVGGICGGTVTRVYRVTDDCGNYAECTQIITVDDTTNPTITCPGNFAVQCADDVPAAYADLAAFEAAGGTADDNCDATLTLSLTSDSGLVGGICGGTVTRVYRVTDDCGKYAECTQIITVDDTTDPTITCPGVADVVTNADAGLCTANLAQVFNFETTDPPFYNYYADPGNTAERSSASAFGGSGWSAHLQLVGPGSYARVRAPVTAIPDLNVGNVSGMFQANIQPGSHPNVGPFLMLDVDANQNGTWDGDGAGLDAIVIAFVTGAAPYGQGCWYTDGLNGSTVVHVVGNRTGLLATEFSSSAGGGVMNALRAHTFAGATTWGDLGVLNVRVGAGLWPGSGPFECYVDDIMVAKHLEVPRDASDNCQEPSVTGVRSDSMPLDAPYPASTTITWTASDCCGNSASCGQSVTVNAVNELLVSVQLEWAFTGTRCITFELWDCSPLAGPTIVKWPIVFSAGLATGEIVEIPCGEYTCLTARDALHTLRQTADDFADGGAQYTASFTSGSGDALIGGNLNDDYWIDILDFGVFSYQWGASYDSDGDSVADANTTCTTPYPHAEINGTVAGLYPTTVWTDDFSFIQINFLKHHEANCCGQAGIHGNGDRPLFEAEAATEPVTSITVEELRARGMGELAAGDLNHDGVLDMLDVVAFVAGARPHVGDPEPAEAMPAEAVPGPTPARLRRP